MKDSVQAGWKRKVSGVIFEKSNNKNERKGAQDVGKMSDVVRFGDSGTKEKREDSAESSKS